MDKHQPAPGAPKKALKYDKQVGLVFAGVPARDLTADETAGWVRNQAQYDEMIASGAYSVVDPKPAAQKES